MLPQRNDRLGVTAPAALSSRRKEGAKPSRARRKRLTFLEPMTGSHARDVSRQRMQKELCDKIGMKEKEKGEVCRVFGDATRRVTVWVLRVCVL